MDEHGWTWPSILDPDRARARSLGADYQPHFILVDRDGRIAASHEGGADEEDWSGLLARLP